MTKSRFQTYFDPFKEVSNAPLIVFRIIFGALMLFGISRFLINGWVEQLYIEPTHYFTYLGFDWVRPLDGNLMYAPFILMIIASISIMLGMFYRWGTVIFFICFTYIELLDKSNYLNHYYFVSLVSFLMIWVPANARFSIDVLLMPSIKRSTMRQWHSGIIKFQLSVVYIFAGIAKVNSDWLFEAQPLKTWLQAHHQIPVVGGYLQQDWAAYLFSWSGCIYDLFIVFFLLSARFRPFAYFFVVFFHLVTWYLFPIGVFPWVMIFSTLIFFSDHFHEGILNRLGAVNSRKKKTPLPRPRKFVRTALLVYVVIQLLVPMRFLLYKGDLFWNEEGFQFSWRVMLMHKEGHATFYLVDKKTGRESEIQNSDFLTPTQEDQMATQPDMILQYADILREHYDGQILEFGDYKFPIDDPEIRAEIYVSLNGRPSQLFVDKKHDLTKLPYNLAHREWIETLKE
ncbi:MAG: HTTM domain-containing protein [Crocinitomicaceae bacterium]|nr:HTTM domain-containing protein [Crocinitomicaceae bacterium]